MKRWLKKSAEVRLEKEDLMQMLEKALNLDLFSCYYDGHVVTDISLHPNNKYVIRIELKDKNPLV